MHGLGFQLLGTESGTGGRPTLFLLGQTDHPIILGRLERYEVEV